MDPQTTPPAPAPAAPAPIITSIPVDVTPEINPSLTPVIENSPNFFSKRNIIIGIIAIIFLILVTSVFYILRSRFSRMSLNNLPPLIGALKEDLSKYDSDTDSDGYPDFIETEIGINPLVSEYDTCKKSGCTDSTLQQTNTKHNVLIILDSSGSMGIGNPNRMEIAKQAIKNYISKSSENTQIGLMVYGHKGSNSQSDKAVSCSSAEVISPIGQIVSSTVDGFLSLIKPVGWTPMGLAIEQATQVFVGKEGQNNEIILLTDGEETCDTNPVQKALTLKSSVYNVKVNVIGFAVDSNAQSQLNQISTSGGGTFTTANNLTELDQRFNDLYENGLKLLSDLKCNSANVDAFRTCYNSTFQKVMDWIQKRRLQFYDKKISQDEYNKLEDLSTKLYAQQKDVTTKETQKLIDDFKQKQNATQ